MPAYKLLVIAPKSQVKATKEALEREKRLDKTQKITRLPANRAQSDDRPSQLFFLIEPALVSSDEHFLLPTTEALEDPSLEPPPHLLPLRDDILKKFHLPPSLSIAIQPLLTPEHKPSPISQNGNVLSATISSWRKSLPDQCTTPWRNVPYSYTIYHPLLLLPSNIFPLPWPEIQSSDLAPHLPSLFQRLRERFGVTHIAINAPIPLQLAESLPNELGVVSTRQPGEDNRLRSPSNLIPLDGDFGSPFPCAPTAENVARALWVSTIQHDVTQTWAPLHTMFSRGNVREKARVLSFCESTIPDLGERANSTAVDLYAGIGYFAFCYAKSGVGLVLGWELNGWSVEGGRRGAEANKWVVGVVGEGKEWAARGWSGEEREAVDAKKERLVFFHEDNEKAVERIEKVRDRIPPVRHVNLGLLPTSRGSWKTAVTILDRRKVGWVHAHENCPIAEIEERRREIEGAFERLVREHERLKDLQENEAKSSSRSRRYVRCEHVERVKTYAPGIMHCVFDICIAPQSSNRHLSSNTLVAK